MSANKALCVTIITVFAPSFFYHIVFLVNLRLLHQFLESRAPVGSSHNNNFGFLAIALAIETLCCSPPES